VNITLLSGGKRTVEKHRRRWDDDTKNDVKNVGYAGVHVSELNLCCSEYAIVQGCIEDVI
jgi:hypothetical protein